MTARTDIETASSEAQKKPRQTWRGFGNFDWDG
jgi:hypothetical protein